jgi:cell division protein FtsB
MVNPLLHAFFMGRATAEVLTDRFEDAITDFLSALGKFDAEQREKLREFTAEVVAKAKQQEEAVPPPDLQETLDNLRAEIAQLKAELQQYRSRNAS